MTFRLLARSFLGPLRSAGIAVSLGVAAALLWLMVLVSVMMAAGRGLDLPFLYDGLADRLGTFNVIVAVIVAGTLLRGEARDGTLLMDLLQPVSRARYYTARVAGRALFGLAYYLLAVGGALAVLLIHQARIFPDADSPLTPDLLGRVLLGGLGLASVILSLAALAPISSSRFGHIIYWAGLGTIVSSAASLSREPHGISWYERGFAFLGTEILGPALFGPSARFLREAGFSDWHLVRAFLQWGFGAALAYAVGVFAFSRMEVGLRR